MAADVPNKPLLDYPFTSIIVDTLLAERSSSWTGNYQPVEPGTPFSAPPTHSVAEAAKYAGTISLGQRAGKDNEFQQRFWATIPHTQDVYNYEISYVGEANANPIFKRIYREQRDTYTPRTKGSALTGLYAITITAAGLGYLPAPAAPPAVTCNNGATAVAVVDPADGSIAKITLKTEGASCTTSVTIAAPPAGGVQATATGVLQPAACVLVKEETKQSPAPWDALFIDVERIYMTLPGPVLTGVELDPATGNLVTVTEQIVAAGTAGTAMQSNGSYADVTPIDSVISKKTTGYAVGASLAAGQSWNNNRHVSLPRVLLSLTNVAFNDTDGKTIFTGIWYYIKNYTGYWRVAIDEKWYNAPNSPSTPANFCEQGFSWITPLGSGSVPECLHPQVEITGNTASDGSTPAGGGRFYAYIVWDFIFPATTPSGLSGQTVYLDQGNRRFNGGFLYRSESVYVT